MKEPFAPIIPAYHLSPHEVSGVLDRLPAGCEAPLFVYNDEEAAVREHLESLERNNQIRAIYLPFQVGKVEAVRRGLQTLLATSTAEVIVQVDGHLKQPPEEISDLVQKLIETRSHMVVTNRYGLQDMNDQIHRVTAADLFSALVRQLTGYQVSDLVCGTRAYTRELARHFLRLRCFGYALEIEEVLIAASLGMQVQERPTHSNRQEDATNTEKIEDNAYAILCYANETKMSDDFRAKLSFILASLKKRVSFDVDTSVFGLAGVVRFEYTGRDLAMINAYTSGTSRDGYSISRISETA